MEPRLIIVVLTCTEGQRRIKRYAVLVGEVLGNGADQPEFSLSGTGGQVWGKSKGARVPLPRYAHRIDSYGSSYLDRRAQIGRLLGRKNNAHDVASIVTAHGGRAAIVNCRRERAPFGN